MAHSRKRRKGIGSVNPDSDDEKEVHISATASRTTTSLSYSLYDGREEKKLRTAPPPATVRCQPEIKSQSKKRSQVFTLSLVLAAH